MQQDKNSNLDKQENRILTSKYIDPFTDFGFKRLFEKIFESAEIAKLSNDEYEQYIMSLKVY